MNNVCVYMVSWNNIYELNSEELRMNGCLVPFIKHCCSRGCKCKHSNYEVMMKYGNQTNISIKNKFIL